MFKKLGTLALAAAITVLGSQAPANAAAGDASAEAIASQNTTFSFPLSSTPFTVPAGVSYVNLNKNWNLRQVDLEANAGKTIEISGSLTKPDGSVVNIESSNMNSGLVSVSINIATSSAGMVSNNWNSTSVTIPATGATGGSANLSLYLGGLGMDGTRTPVAAGTYTFVGNLKVDGAVVTDGVNWQDPWTVSNSTYSVALGGSTITAPAGASNASFNAGICVDSTKIAVDDTLTAKGYLDGVAKSSGMVSWNWRGYVSGSWRQSTQPTNNSTKVVSGDITNGLSGSISFGSSVTGGVSYNATFQILNQNNVDVTGSCAPAAPAKPTFVMNGSTLTGSFQLPAFGDQMSNDCQLFDAAAPTVVVANSNNNYAMNGAPVNCSFSTGLVAGHSYFIKARGSYQSIKGPWSEASDSVLKSASGYTLTSPVSGANQGGKASLLNVDINADTDASPITTTGDGANGLLVLASTPNADPMAGGAIDSFKIRHITQAGVDTTFAQTGAVTINSSADGIATNGRVAWYGARNKWVASYANFATMGMNPAPEVKIVTGTWSASASTTTTVAASVFSATCASTLGAGYGAIINGGMMSPPSVSLVPLSAPTDAPIYLLNCSKQYQIAGTGMTLSMPLIVSVPNATTVTVIKALGTPGANVNVAQSMGISANPAAGANDAAVTIFARTALQTGMSTQTVDARSIYTIKKDLTVSTLTSTWSPVALEPSLRVAAVNDGTIWGTMVEGMSLRLFKLAGDTLTTVAITPDASADFPVTQITLPQGLQAGNSSLLTVVRTNAAASAIASATIDTTSGAMSTNEVVKNTYVSGNGVTSAFTVDSKNVYWFMTNTASSTKYSVYRWRDPAYVPVVAAAQTINWTASPSSVTVGSTVTVAATATSNLAVVYASTDTSKCTVTSAGVVTPVATTGTCTITADQAGNDSFTAAPQKSLNITIAAAVVVPVKSAPKVPTVATKVKIAKTFTVALSATKGTAAKGANVDGLATTVTTTTKTICSVTAVKKSAKITGYTVKGLKAGACKVVLTITGNATYNALTKTVAVTVSK